MTREDIIRMAREAGIGPVYGYESIERFAALVAAAERERIKTANAPEIEKANAYIKMLEDSLAAERKPLTDAPTEEMLRAVSEQFDADVAMGIGFNAQTLCRAMLRAAIRARGEK